MSGHDPTIEDRWIEFEDFNLRITESQNKYDLEIDAGGSYFRCYSLTKGHIDEILSTLSLWAYGKVDIPDEIEGEYFMRIGLHEYQESGSIELMLDNLTYELVLHFKDKTGVTRFITELQRPHHHHPPNDEES
jgi:hypothetical protein